jgi:glycosyltransferase involved in cell wall biosynthesis
MVIPSSFEKPIQVLKKYKININDSVLFTLSRLSSTEHYKGYDIVLKALSDVVKVRPNLNLLGERVTIKRLKWSRFL